MSEAFFALPTLTTQIAQQCKSSVDLVVGQLKALREGLDG